VEDDPVSRKGLKTICNMSAQIVQHWEVALRSLAKDVMKLTESRWSEIEPAAFRNKNGA
jgi:hypothetical protein